MGASILIMIHQHKLEGILREQLISRMRVQFFNGLINQHASNILYHDNLLSDPLSSSQARNHYVPA